MKLFVEHIKGYMVVFSSVKKINIGKIDNKNYLFIEKYSSCENDKIKLSDIRLAFLVDTETMKEYFRYEK